MLHSVPPNNMQTELGRVQSIKHDLEVAERHRKLEHIFERKKKEESLRGLHEQHTPSKTHSIQIEFTTFWFKQLQVVLFYD